MYYVEVEMKGQASGAVVYTYRYRWQAMAHVRRELMHGHVCVVYWASEDGVEGGQANA